MGDELAHWDDFMWLLMVGTRAETRTVQVSFTNWFTQPPIQWGAIQGCAVMATLPAILLFRWLQRYVVVTGASAGVK